MLKVMPARGTGELFLRDPVLLGIRVKKEHLRDLSEAILEFVPPNRVMLA